MEKVMKYCGRKAQTSYTVADFSPMLVGFLFYTGGGFLFCTVADFSPILVGFLFYTGGGFLSFCSVLYGGGFLSYAGGFLFYTVADFSPMLVDFCSIRWRISLLCWWISVLYGGGFLSYAGGFLFYTVADFSPMLVDFCSIRWRISLLRWWFSVLYGGGFLSYDFCGGGFLSYTGGFLFISILRWRIPLIRSSICSSPLRFILRSSETPSTEEKYDRRIVLLGHSR